VPYYWKRGLIVGLVTGLMLHVLLQQLADRHPVQPEGNVPVASVAEATPTHRPTPLGPLMGLTIFVLCCVMPAPGLGRVGP
jgi:hypothetical protein